MSENGITTAAEYARLTERRVTLPSGAVFILRRPTVSFRLRNFGVYQSIAARTQGGGPIASSDDEVKKIAEYYYDVLCECCAWPRVSLAPQEGELHPEQIQLRDALFIARWAGGEVSAEGADLAEFHERREPAAAPGASGGNLELPAERIDNRPSAIGKRQSGDGFAT